MRRDATATCDQQTTNHYDPTASDGTKTKTESAGSTAKGHTKMATFEELQKGGGDFKPCPEGRHSARLVDVVDEGWQETTYQGQHTGYAPHLKFVWETAPYEYEYEVGNEWAKELEGKTFLIFDRRMKLSTHENAHLRKTLDSWLTPKGVIETFSGGKNVIDVIESLIGRAACIQVQHNKSADGKKTYANIATVLPHGRRDAPLPEKTVYIRRCLREDWATKKPDLSYRIEADEALTILEGKPPVPRLTGLDPNQPLPETSHQAAAAMTGTAPVAPSPPIVPNPAPPMPTTPPVDVSQMQGAAHTKSGQGSTDKAHTAAKKALASGETPPLAAAPGLLNAVQFATALKHLRTEAIKYDAELPMPLPTNPVEFATWEPRAKAAIEEAAGTVFDDDPTESGQPVLLEAAGMAQANTAHV